MADKIDYGTLKKGGFMRQKQKGYFSLRLGIVGGQVTAEQLAAVTDVANTFGHGRRWQREELPQASADRGFARLRPARAVRYVPTPVLIRRPSHRN